MILNINTLHYPPHYLLHRPKTIAVKSLPVFSSHSPPSWLYKPFFHYTIPIYMYTIYIQASLIVVACISKFAPWICDTLKRTAIQCNTLQHTATHSNTMHATRTSGPQGACWALQHTAMHCNTLQHTAMHCNTLQHTASHFNTMHASIYSNITGWRRPCAWLVFQVPFHKSATHYRALS